MRRLLIASFAILLSVGTADAQIFNNPTRTYGVGDSTGPGPRWSGLGLGVFPLNFRGSPGPAEGTYSAPDHRIFNVAPSFGMGLGWFGKRSPSPRPEPNFPFNPPVQNSTAEPPLDLPPDAKPVPEPIAAPKQSITIEVRVPIENAQVFVNNQPTKQTGMVRMFGSPALPAGAKYQYEIRVEWSADGQSHVVKETLIGAPGEKLIADFAKH